MDTPVWLLLVLLVAEQIQCYQNPARKSWWAKRVLSDDFYTAGRLSERQIKYASESNFRTLISVFPYDDSVAGQYGQGDLLPSTKQAEDIARLAGIKHITLLGDRAWKNIDALDILEQALYNSDRPILVYDDNAFAATLLLLLHFARTNASDPEVKADDIFIAGSHLGFDYSDPEIMGVIFNVTGHRIENPARPDAIPSDWYNHYWPAKPLYKNWFTAGQIQKGDILKIKDVFPTLINFRKGTTTSGQRTQEEVTLLNIRDRTGTYTDYISLSSTINYESRNNLEFGDSVGYNEKLERSFIKINFEELQYTLLPIGGQYSYSTSMWNAYRDDLMAADRTNQPVLAHCRTGFRSVVVALLAVAYIHHLDSEWVLARARQIGYDIPNKAPQAPSLYTQVLDNRSSAGNKIYRYECVLIFSMVILSVCNVTL